MNIQKQQEELVVIDEYQFQTLFRNIYDDINLVINSDEMTNYMYSESDDKRNEAEQMFSRFLKSKQNIYQLRFLSIDGKELIRVDKKDGEVYKTAESELQNKKDRYYFQTLSEIKEGTMYISDFDLNVENGELEIPYTPTIRFAMPVYYNDQRTGFLIANIYGLNILEIFNDYEKNKFSALKLGLIDNNHLISLNILETFNSIESSFINIPENFDQLYSKIDRKEDRGRFDYNGDSYFYNHVNIENAAFDIRFDENGGRWTIISSFNAEDVIKAQGGFFIRHPGLKLINSLIVSIVTLIVLTFFTLRESEHLLIAASGIISDFSHDGIVITDSSKRVIYCNPIFEDLFGYNFHEIKGKNPRDFLKGIPPIIVEDDNKQNDIIWEGNVWDISADNVHIQRYLKMRTVSSSDNRVAYYIGIYSEPKIIKDTEENDLVRIPGSMLSTESLNYLSPQLSLGGADGKNKFALILLRITELAILRSKLTHNEESTLISNLSLVLKKGLNTDCGVFAPSSGLLFIAVSLNVNESIEVLMDRIDRAVSSVQFSDSSCSVQYLSGIAISPEHGSDGKELVENAYIALEAISRIKAVKYLLYNQDIYNAVNQHFRIKKEIEKAYMDDEFTVVYQPQNNAVTRKMNGVEALVRWNNEKLGNVPPYLFVPVMEEDPNQIKRLGKHILSKVVSECEKILPHISEDFRVSVNLSAQEFADSALILELVNIVSRSSFPSSNICFEITETVISDNLNQTNNIINVLHKNNITVAIDDFGTGYSSLGYLKKLESDKLKVDRMFIKDYPEYDDGSILKAITKLSHELGMKVIVEGVETEEQLTFINQLECQEFQGYLYSKPVPIDKIFQLLLKEKT